MGTSNDGLEELSADQCWEMLRDHRIGRVAYCLDGQPACVPIDYAVDGETIVIRSGSGRKAGVGAGEGRIAIEIDDLGTDQPWSVLAKGTARLVSADELAEAAAVLLEPSAGVFGRTLFLRIEVDEVTGRRLQGT